ncbi:PREDICTED: uncharacterized protein LOC106126234 isoform X2 [Papilio xuthus]|uniref:Uncharacterized protein LOC106126234 isoform X2 n=1 Tax=Papilio xuthus TaxID=66420 RepID=A0AAJ7EJ03_PAPXU|nr:PREDICTED: uncharacterized protein LOC106126234 isoform X2 [Papilio xuthus]
MFPSFISILDIQSWWEVPSIAYFCSLFRTAFNLLDFDIEELEEALLTDGTEETASSLLTELIVRLLNGCFGNNDISAFNYQMYLRRLFRRKCQETGRYNPFNTDIDFQFLPLRTKVEILYALCDFRLDAEDVFELFKNLESESLRVEPLGWDNNDSAYWYFYGTRLYREDVIRKPKSRGRRKRGREGRKRGWFYGDDWLDDDESVRVWQVVCFTENDWNHLTDKFRRATSKVEKELYRSLSQNFLPEIPRLFHEKERLQRKSCRPRLRSHGIKNELLEVTPRRTSSRVLQKIEEKERERKRSLHEATENEAKKQSAQLARDTRARRRERLRTKSTSSDSSDESSDSEEKEMPQKVSKSKKTEKQTKQSTPKRKGSSPPPVPPVKTGRKTNNSLASATGQIVIPDTVEPVNSTRRKLKTSQIFTQTDEDVQIDMYKVLEQLTAHDDAWPFMDPVEEDYAPNYYAVIRRPMDLHKMEERLDSGFYTDFNMFKADFKLIVNNCRLYNGQDNEYTTMVDNLQAAFDRLTEKYVHQVSSSDEEIAVEYQLPTPSRKHKIKTSESPPRHQGKKKKSQSDAEPQSSSSDQVELEEKEDEEEEEEEIPEPNEEEESKESHKIKKKRKGHHRHGKHSKIHKKYSHKYEHESRIRHSKKHAKNKDKDGKKSKRKKSKHQEVETEEMKRSESQESLESSNRSRSASPLPSIHTPSPSPSPSPTPSPTEADRRQKRRLRDQRNRREVGEQSVPRRKPEPQQSDQLADPDFYKDKYDKIKERRRHAAKDAWDTLFDYKQKTMDKQKRNLRIPEKDKNQKLRETIEKLKAKNDKYGATSLFNSLFTCQSTRRRRRSSDSDTKDSNDSAKEDDSSDSSSDDEDLKQKITPKKKGKKTTARNESATVALEQAVKDISKWLDDTPKGSAVSCASNSPTQTISTEDPENSRQDDESSQGDKSLQAKKETTRKRPSSREPKLVKRREIQRTIDRLQPGKSKGNLLTNVSNKTSDKLEETDPTGPLHKSRETVKGEESCPKLSLGSVLPSVEFTLGSDHNFTNDEDKTAKKIETITSADLEQPLLEEDKAVSSSEDKPTPTKKDAEVETEPTILPKPNQEKATPNLSAWFKAFGAPKASASSTITSKKKNEHESDEKTTDKMNFDNKLTGMKIATKFDFPNGPETPEGGGESPLPHASTTPRQRRTSTGSSVSERSSFSQDLDSPRHHMSLTSPLLRSPASPRYDDFQKVSYPIINGTVRAGFYQDTTSVKSSPEKSCSPREMPQSPYSPYSQHVYISSTATGSATPNYFVDHNKSPLPAYGQNAPSYYEASKSPLVSKPARNHDDYSSLATDSYQQNVYKEPFPSTCSPYQQGPAKDYSHPSVSTHPVPVMNNPVSCASAQINSDSKTTHFPVKKRTYNEPEELTKKSVEPKDMSAMTKTHDHQKITQPSYQMSNASVDDIALALTEKSENLSKKLCMREKSAMEYSDRHSVETTVIDYDSDVREIRSEDVISDSSKSIGMMRKDCVDMINMGYMNSDKDRRNSSEMREIDYAKTNTAINLGINNHQPQISLSKASMPPSNMTPAHCHDRQISDMPINHNVAHMHHKQYDAANFSLNDIELANKKLYGCNSSLPPSATAIDYGNWKVTNQIRKTDIMPSDYSNSYTANHEDKLKPEINLTTTAALNYNKNLQQEQYNAYNSVPRASLQRAQELHQNLQGEIRIPNPRTMHKTDHMMAPPTHCDTEAIAKNIETLAKSQKSDKFAQNHRLASSIPYKTSYSTHSSIPLETLRSIPNIPQMLERYSNEDRYLSSFSSTGAPLYHDPITTSVNSVYSQHSPSVSREDNMYKASSTITSAHQELKPKTKRKRTTENKPSPVVQQTYHSPPCSTDMLNPVKTNMMPTSAFNFGATPTLGAPLYGENSGFSIEDLRNSTNQLMAVNYMAAAVAHQQRNTAETSAEKLVKPAHQNTTHGSGSFPYIAHGQVRAGYPFVSAEASQPLYQQYLQRHQEELLRHSGAQIMSLYSPAYPAALGVRAPPYDGINRHSWL